MQKIMGDEHGQHVMELAKDLVGASGMLTGSARLETSLAVRNVEQPK